MLGISSPEVKLIVMIRDYLPVLIHVISLLFFNVNSRTLLVNYILLQHNGINVGFGFFLSESPYLSFPDWTSASQYCQFWKRSKWHCVTCHDI